MHVCVLRRPPGKQVPSENTLITAMCARVAAGVILTITQQTTAPRRHIGCQKNLDATGATLCPTNRLKGRHSFILFHVFLPNQRAELRPLGNN